MLTVYKLFHCTISADLKEEFCIQIGITPTHIKVTLKAFRWGDIANIPHLIATRMPFWLGAFSKIQSMFTNSLSPNSLEKKQNLRLQRNILIYYHKTAVFRGYLLKIIPPANKKKKPLSRRGNHALIAASFKQIFFLNTR